MGNSVREFAILYVGGKGAGKGTIGGGNALLNAGQHKLDGPEHSGALDLTRLDASVGAHGLLTKLSGLATDVLGGDGIFRPETGDLPWFNVMDYGATGNGVTNDTAAIQATIDAAVAAGGGVIYFPPGVYIVAGALQDTGAFNGQLLLPNVDHADPQIVLVFKGALRPPYHPVYGLTTLPAGLSVIKSTLAGASGTAACISGGNDTTPSYLGGGNNLAVVVDDIVSLSPDNPTFTFWNLIATQGGAIPSLQITTPGAFAGTPTQPTNANNYGIKLPAAYFSNGTPCGTLSVGGQYTGVLNGELTDFSNLILGPGIYGLEQPDMLYPSTVRRMTTTAVQRVVRATGAAASRLDVLSYVRESATNPPFAAWMGTVYDVDDASNRIEGYWRYHCTETGGTPDTFRKNGGATVGEQEMGPDWGGSGSPTGAAGGDLSGTYPNPAVSKVEGVDVTDGGTTGDVLTKTGATAATWQTPAPASSGGELLLSSTASVPPVFGDILTTTDETDFVYSS